MAIMRSWSFMEKVKRYKRKKVDWYALRLELGDPDVESYYWLQKQWRFDHKLSKLSLQRASYNALRHVFGDVRLLHYRLTGRWENPGRV